MTRWRVAQLACLSALLVGCAAEEVRYYPMMHDECYGVRGYRTETTVVLEGVERHLPGLDDFYPERAVRMEVVGTATVQCESEGVCQLITEDGAYGFGPTALRWATRTPHHVAGKGPFVVKFRVPEIGKCSRFEAVRDISGQGPAAR